MAMSLKEIDIPGVHKLAGHLEAVSEFIRSGELKWYFEVKLFDCEEAVPDIKQLIKSACPNAKPEAAEISAASAEDVVKTLEHELGRFCPPVEALRVLGPISTFTAAAAMWEYIAECVDYERCRIYEYTSSEQDSCCAASQEISQSSSTTRAKTAA
jgi:hypothetical protein